MLHLLGSGVAFIDVGCPLAYPDRGSPAPSGGTIPGERVRQCSCVRCSSSPSRGGREIHALLAVEGFETNCPIRATAATWRKKASASAPLKPLKPCSRFDSFFGCEPAMACSGENKPGVSGSRAWLGFVWRLISCMDGSRSRRTGMADREKWKEEAGAVQTRDPPIKATRYALISRSWGSSPNGRTFKTPFLFQPHQPHGPGGYRRTKRMSPLMADV